MYVCTYVRMYVCMCVCMYVCMYVCVYIRMYIRDDRGQHHFAPGEVRLRLPLDVAIRSIQFCPQDLSFFLLYKRCNSFWFHAQVRTDSVAAILAWPPATLPQLLHGCRCVDSVFADDRPAHSLRSMDADAAPKMLSMFHAPSALLRSHPPSTYGVLQVRALLSIFTCVAV